VVGSVNADITFTVEALPDPGQTVLASAVASAAGGKGGNQAVAAARAGADVALVAAVGTDGSAEMLVRHLQDNGVDVSPVQRVPGASGSAAIIVDAHAENCIVVAPGANGHLGVSSPALQSTIADSDVVLISLEIPMDTAVAAAGVGREGGAAVIVNASPTVTDADHRRRLAEHADVVVVNETEAADWDDAAVTHLVVTRGARGARYLHDGRTTDIPAPQVEAVDTTGAGDVFAGVLAASWPTGAEQALRRGCAAGALATLVPGAGDCAPTAEAIDDVLSTL
jgi:ribokinase